MKCSNKISCSSGATINKTNLKINPKNNSLFVGIMHNKVNTKNEYLTILDFDLCTINLNSFDSAFLNLYINDSKFINNKSVSYTHLTLPTTVLKCRSRWSPYH